MARREGSNALSQVALWLSIIGALNWGLVGFFDWDLVRAIFGNESSTPASALARIIYALVGLAGLALAFLAPRLRAREASRTTLGERVEART
jgi:hypothetical protein